MYSLWFVWPLCENLELILKGITRQEFTQPFQCGFAAWYSKRWNLNEGLAVYWSWFLSSLFEAP